MLLKIFAAGIPLTRFLMHYDKTEILRVLACNENKKRNYFVFLRGENLV